MSLANVLRKLKKEAGIRSKYNGHELGRFKPDPEQPGTYQACCWICKKTCHIRPAVEVGVHEVAGETFEEACIQPAPVITVEQSIY